ncbi:hypothetical protein DIPPA_05978 [Diplonema papillatum]|nr:hypothetical protein DIPPA_05978 [Diplonema papillatum]
MPAAIKWPQRCLDFCRLVGVRHPIMLAPMAGISNPTMVAAAQRAGILGAHGAAYRKVADLDHDLRLIEEQNVPSAYAVNVFRLDLPKEPPSEESVARSTASLRPFYEAVGKEPPANAQTVMAAHLDLIDVALAHRAPVIAAALGAFSKEEVRAIKEASPTTKVFGTATSVAEAVHLKETGVDAIVAQGYEAGGHRSTFLPATEMLSTFTLVPQVVDAVGTLPVIAAGGIMDGRGIISALTLGASAVSMGTAFLPCVESSISASQLAAMRAPAAHTTLTKAWSGRTARGVASKFTAEYPDAAITAFPMQGTLTGELRKAAVEQGRTDLLCSWCGQGVRMMKPDRPTVADVCEGVLTEAGLVLQELRG